MENPTRVYVLEPFTGEEPWGISANGNAKTYKPGRIHTVPQDFADVLFSSGAAAPCEQDDDGNWKRARPEED